MLRACVLAVEALRRAAIQHPEQNIILIQQAQAIQMLVSKQPIDRDRFERYLTEIQANNFKGPMTFDLMNLSRQAAPMWVRYGPGVGNPKDQFVKFFNAVARGAEKEFIKNYSFDISPVTDNRPFFYYFYWPSFSLAIEKFAANIIWFQLLEAIIFAALFILVPLYSFGKKQFRGLSSNIWFFFLLGLGYMMIEISFIQRFVLYLGHPIYALALVLVVLLICSGIGSWLYQAVFKTQKWAVWAAIAAITLMSLAGIKLLPDLVLKTISQGLWLRVMAASLWTMLLGIAMGIPFPAGINALSKSRDNLVPWAWAINISASVVSSILAVILAMSFGFAVVSALAAAIYLLAGISYQLLAKA